MACLHEQRLKNVWSTPTADTFIAEKVDACQARTAAAKSLVA